MANAPTKVQLVEHREQINDTGLLEQIDVHDLRISLAPPTGWVALQPQKTTMYTHVQWRSPTRRTAVGVTHVRMPLPLSTRTLIWLAGGEINKKAKDGQLLRQWTDNLGREWFEARDEKYHMTGYVMTRGLDAWISYSGYRLTEPEEPAEQELGLRSVETILPINAATVKRLASASTE